MKRYSSYIGAAVSGLALFFAVLHTVFPLSWVALVPLFFALDKASPRQAAKTGFCTGLTLAILAFNWMIPGAVTFTEGPIIYGIAIFLLCTILFSLGWAMLCRIFVWLRNRHNSFLTPSLLAAALWTLTESTLQWAARSMPWFLFHMGNALSANLYAIQPISYIGIGGAGFIIVFVNYNFSQAFIHRSWKKSILPILTITAYMLLGWGLLTTFHPSSQKFTISLIATNIPPGTRWEESNGNRLVSHLLDLERQSVSSHPDIIGWSESAIPWTYRPDDDLIRELTHISDSAKITHLIGINTESSTNEIYNSAYCLLPGGTVSGRYDKNVPLFLIERSWNGWSIPFLSSDGYTVRPGISGLPLTTPYGKAGILICNESALPAEAADRVRHGAQFLFNMSNDGWFRDTYLVSQHFYNARLRAVETRKDLVINSNLGWSGLVSASGEIIEARHSDLSFISTLSVHPNNLQPLAVTHPWLPVACSLLILLFIIGSPSVPRLKTFFCHRHPNHKPIKQNLMRSKTILLFILLSATGSQAFSNFSQAHWRWRKDDGPLTHATWTAPQDFPSTLPFTVGTPIRLRIELYNSLGNNETGTVGLQYQRGSSGPWTTISNTSAGFDFVMAGSSSYVTDKQALTSALIRDDGAGAFLGGKVLVSTFNFADTLNAGTKKEYEWCIRPTASLSLDSAYQFRMTFTGTSDAMNYGSPLPDMMFRPNVSIPGNAGIYRDSLVTGFFNRDSGWIASDGSFSIPLSDGRDLWAMNDSYINNYDTLAGTTGCLFQVRNSALVQPQGNWNWTSTSTRIGSGPGIPSLFKNNPDDNHLLWPMSGYQYGDTVYVYCSSIMNSSGGLGFTSGGNDYLGKMIFPSLTVSGFDSLQSFNGITFGLGFDTNEPGNYIYTWGIKGGFITSNIVVARFPKNNPLAHWSFWNGSAWDTAVSHIATIATGASNGAFVTKVRNKYVLVSTEFSVSCDAGTHIYTATSDNITGPFSTQKTLYTIPDDVLGHSPFFYAPSLHPEYINSRNEILLTYDINGYSNCVPACINNGYNPDYYRPRGLRVPLSLIDSGITSTTMPPSHTPDHRNSWKISVFPNPSHSLCTLTLEGCTEREVNLVLLNAEGKSVYHYRMPVNSTFYTKAIQLPEGLPKGFYILQAQGHQSTRFAKLLLQ